MLSNSAHSPIAIHSFKDGNFHIYPLNLGNSPGRETKYEQAVGGIIGKGMAATSAKMNPRFFLLPV